jgi:hypothetical protein
MRTSTFSILGAATTLLTAATALTSGCGQGESEPGLLLTPLYGSAAPRDPRIMPMHRPGETVVRTAPTATHLNYYGGHVIANVKIVPVYWGTGTMISASAMHGFYSAVVANPHLDWLSEYDTNIKAVDGSTGTGQHIGRGTVDTKDYVITPSITSKSLTDDNVQTELAHQIDTHVLPAPDANTIYMIHFPLKTTIDLGGARSCQTFCAYHSTLSKGGQSVYYSVLPFMGTGSGCEGGCGSATKDLDNQSSVSSHELVEAITDGEIGLVTGSIGKPAAWYDPTNGEIGDICNAEQGTLPGTTYIVQKEWSNKAGACVLTAGTCTKSCTGKVCGDDGCGGSCGTCAAGKTCNSSGQCVNSCTPSCSGKTCGPDGCGGSCGTCAAGKTCSSAGVCVSGGGTCAHDKCVSGKKLSSTCDPCVTKICADDAYCCSNKWDSTCVAEVADICGETC